MDFPGEVLTRVFQFRGFLEEFLCFGVFSSLVPFLGLICREAASLKRTICVQSLNGSG
jgi:hypothetical protein